MAAPAQTLPNCSEQKTDPDPQGRSATTTNLKNGSSMEDLNSDDVSGNIALNNRVKSPNYSSQNREMKMDNFQDGGTQLNSTRPTNVNADQIAFSSNIDRTRLGTEYQSFNQNSRDSMMMVDDFRNSQESPGHGPVASYGTGFNERGYVTDQHGGQCMPTNAAASDPMPQNSPQNKMYSQFSQSQMRSGFGPTPRPMNVAAPQRPTALSNIPNSQRFLGGQTPQGGPTPTLNQLLQAPNPLQRFQNSYSDYNSNQSMHSKGTGSVDPTSHAQYMGSGSAWGNARGGSGAYSQHMTNMMYRGQSGAVPQETNLKRSCMSPGQQSSPNASSQQSGQSQGQYSQQQYSQRSYPQTPTPQRSYPQYGIQGGSSNSQVAFEQQQQQQRSQTQSSSNFSQIQNQSSQDVSASNLDELSSDSNSGGGSLRTPGTPPTSQQGQRPVPSPSGSSSTGSRSMSPAIGTQQNIPMPPRPSSSQSDSGATTINQPTSVVQGYNQQMSSPMYGNKLPQGMMGGASQMGPYSPQSAAHYSQGNYRHQNSMPMQGYASQSQNSYGIPPSGHAVYSQGVMGRMPNHTAAGSQNYGNGSYINSHYSGSGPGYGMNSMMPPPTASSAGMRSSSPMYLRQHLQQKYGGNYNNMGPMAPPTSAGLGLQQPCHDGSLLPPPSASAPTSAMGPSLPSVSTPGSMAGASSEGSTQPAAVDANGITQTSAPSVGTSTSVTQSISSPVPSVAVTVSSPSMSVVEIQQPQGQQIHQNRLPPPPVLDEASQASNASASSSLPDDRSETPKPNSKPTMSHPPTPNTLPSPGAASMSSFHDEFESVSSPSWPRTPASPVVNNQGYEHHPIKRPDGLLKLYDMSDEPDRRMFLDKLIMYSEERGTPISQCPTISKQPLDLYRLYITAKERGGFVEVTKAKHWKDVAGAIGIGASSSAAYTLRKQYIKHLLPFECKYDRGGIDPQPIINQVEASSRKKNVKNSIGQEPFPPPSSQSLDGYPPGSYPGPYPPGGAHGMMMNSDYPPQGPGGHMPYHGHGAMPNHMGPGVENAASGMNAAEGYGDEMQSAQFQRHPGPDHYGYSQQQQQQQNPPNAMMPAYTNTQSSMSGGSYGYTGSGAPPVQPQQDQQQPPPPQQYAEQYPHHPNVVPPTGEGNYPNRGMENYSGSAVGSTPYSASRSMPQHNTSQYPYQGQYDRERYEQQARPPTQGGAMIPPAQATEHSMYQSQRYSQQMGPTPRESVPAQSSGYANRAQGQFPAQSPYPQGQQEPYRNPDGYQSHMSRVQTSLAQRLLSKVASAPQGYGPNHQAMYGQCSTSPNKNTPPAGVQRDMFQRDVYPGVPKRHPDFMKNQPPDQYPASYSAWQRDSQGRPYPPGQGQYSSSGRESWDHMRPSENSPSNTWPMSRFGGPPTDPYSPHGGNQAMVRGMKIPYGRDRYYMANKMQPHPGAPMQPSHYPPQQSRKEIIFPPDTVEGVAPLLMKRRKITAKDVSPLEAWRLMMAIKSGLLAESTWALDVLSVLLYDDNTVLYFGLTHLPGLLEAIMEHFRKCLNVIFGLAEDMEVGFDVRRQKEAEVDCPNCPEPAERKWYETERESQKKDETPELRSAIDIDPRDKVVVLTGENYTHKTRCRKVVRAKADETLFLLDPDKKWDVHEGFNSGVDHWQVGGGDITLHIQTHFQNMGKYAQFVRVLEETKKEVECKEELQNTDSEIIIKQEPVDVDEEDNDQTRIIKVERLGEIPEVAKESCQDDNDDNHEEPAEEITYPRIRPGSARKRPADDEEEEAYNRDEPSLCILSDAQDSLAHRCVCLSTILRNLSFVPGNDFEMSKHAGFLLVLGRLLLLHHMHTPKKPPQRHYDRDDDTDAASCAAADSCSSLVSDREWWWDMLHILRENTLVTLSNIAGQLDLSPYPEEISLPLLDGLLHWVVCPSSYSQDSLPNLQPYSVLSPQRLSLEALCKLSILESNVDLLLATPPWSRLERLFSFLSRSLGKNEDQVLREFSVVLLSNVAQADSSAARTIALQGASISQLITFVEQAEQSALQVANAQGINALRENPELMGTTLDMVRRAAATLRCLASVPDNRSFFLQHQQRLLTLVMSQILDQGVASIIADVLYECSLKPTVDPLKNLPLKMQPS